MNDEATAPAAHRGLEARQEDPDAVFAAARKRLEDQPSGDELLFKTKVAAAIHDLDRLENPVSKYFAGRRARPASLRCYERKMARVMALLVQSGFTLGEGVTDARDFPWHCVDVPVAAAFHALVVDQYALKSSHNLIGVLRELIKESCRAGLCGPGYRDRLLDVLPLSGQVTVPAGRELDVSEIVQLLTSAGQHCNQVLGVRDRAVVATFAATGMRLCELADLDVSDYRASDQSVMIRVTKTGSPRRAWLNETATSEVNVWLALRGDADGPLFLSWAGERLTESGVASLMNNVVARACLKERVTSHDFRRTLATRLLRARVDPFTVARLLGHKRVSTTMVYDRRTELEDRRTLLSVTEQSSDMCEPEAG